MKELLPVVGDRTLARRLVRAGIQGADGARSLAQIPGGIDAYEAGARLGGSLRSVLAAGDRVIELTQSLKGYARPDAEDLKPVDVREGIDDVLRLTAHRVRGIRIDCDYEDVPPVRAHPAKLQQVWTNLIINAAEAIEDETADLVAAAEASGGVPELPARGEAEALIRASHARGRERYHPRQRPGYRPGNRRQDYGAPLHHQGGACFDSAWAWACPSSEASLPIMGEPSRSTLTRDPRSCGSRCPPNHTRRNHDPDNPVP